MELRGRWTTLEHALVLILGPFGFCRSANLLLALTAPFGAATLRAATPTFVFPASALMFMGFTPAASARFGRAHFGCACAGFGIVAQESELAILPVGEGRPENLTRGIK